MIDIIGMLVTAAIIIFVVGCGIWSWENYKANEKAHAEFLKEIEDGKRGGHPPI
jgi:Na+/melibiose symporter-like transporter